MANLRSLQRQLHAAMEASTAFQREFAGDLGQTSCEYFTDLLNEGIRAACWAVEAKLCDCDVAVGGVSARCALFDGLRLARRGVVRTLREAQEATLLTAAGLSALEALDAQIVELVKTAQRELGAVASLRSTEEALRASGLEGVEALADALEAVARTAGDLTQDLHDAAAVRLAGELRCLEDEVRPLVEALDPLCTKRSVNGACEVLWETRMVDVGDSIMHVLRDARAEAGAWAVCVDVAARLREDPDVPFVKRRSNDKLGGARSTFASTSDTAERFADALEAAGAALREEGLHRAGVIALNAAQGDVGHIEGGGTIAPDAPSLWKGGMRWLRALVGASAVLRDAAEHRVPNLGLDNVQSVRDALLTAAYSLEAGDVAITPKAALAVAAAGRRGGAAGAAFRQALEDAQRDELSALLSKVEREVAQVLGACWSAPAFASEFALNDAQGSNPAATATADGAADTAPPVELRAGGDQGRCCLLL